MDSKINANLKYLAISSNGTGKGFGFYEPQPWSVHLSTLALRIWHLPGAYMRGGEVDNTEGQLFPAVDKYRCEMDERARKHTPPGHTLGA